MEGPKCETVGSAILCYGGDSCFLGCLDSNSCNWRKTKAWHVDSLKLVSESLLGSMFGVSFPLVVQLLVNWMVCGCTEWLQ